MGWPVKQRLRWVGLTRQSIPTSLNQLYGTTLAAAHT
jgi:hypothetical protein